MSSFERSVKVPFNVRCSEGYIERDAVRFAIRLSSKELLEEYIKSSYITTFSCCDEAGELNIIVLKIAMKNIKNNFFIVYRTATLGYSIPIRRSI
jgi:hypothetical protein